MCFLHIKTPCFPKCPLFGDGCLNSAKGVPVPTAIWHYYIVHILPDIDRMSHLYNQRPVLIIKSTGLSVCSMCWTWLKIYILSKRMCLYPTDSLDTYKPNLYWYSVVYCGSPCLSVCLSVFLLSVRLSVFLSVSVRPSVCPCDSYPLYDFHNCERKHFIFWYGNSP